MSRGRKNQPALYEPIHGSAPTLAGKDVACPLGAILSATLMLRESFGLETESQWIEGAIDRVLDQGFPTADNSEPGRRIVRGSELTAQIRSELKVSSAKGVNGVRSTSGD
jgi:3-isopropylmalate dehydrogenase